MPAAGRVQGGGDGAIADDRDEHADEPGRDGDIDLVRLAAMLRGILPRLDRERRERVEAAWVSLLNALKQPRADADRLARRLRRLISEIEHLRPGHDDSETTADNEISARNVDESQ